MKLLEVPGTYEGEMNYVNVKHIVSVGRTMSSAVEKKLTYKKDACIRTLDGRSYCTTLTVEEVLASLSKFNI